MDTIVTVIIVLLVLISIGTIAGIFIRKSIHKAVDELDERKNTILSRNMSDEIAKVKQLKMSGETEQKFEHWRKDWDEILETILPSIEEQLNEIEEIAGKYRVKKAKDQLSLVETRLDTVEQQLDMMSEDIERLVSAEQKNRSEISSIKEMHQKLSSELIKKRGSFGEVIRMLDDEMVEVKAALSSFEESTENGSYLQARKQLIQIKNQLEDLSEKMSRIPHLLVQVRSTMPSELANLQMGIKQMVEEGYQLEAFSFDSKIASFKQEIDGAYAFIKELQIKEAEALLESVHQEMEQMYGTLEEEVSCKNKLLAMIPELKEQVIEASKQMQELLNETMQVEKSYLIASEEAQLQQVLQKDLRNVQSQLNVIVDLIDNQKQTFSSLYEMSVEWKRQISELSNGIEERISHLKRLRKDELHAQETVAYLRERLLESKRLLYKSNLPGVPVTHLEALDYAEEQMKQAQDSLSQFPLEMAKVEGFVENASRVVESSTEEVKQMVETARMAELAIQYSNRFRGHDESTRRSLEEAETAFLNYEYDQALELVQSAVRKHEPNLINKVSKHLSA